jgi:hypothetical protein
MKNKVLFKIFNFSKGTYNKWVIRILHDELFVQVTCYFLELENMVVCWMGYVDRLGQFEI